jgi:DNA ligase-1
MPPKRKAATPPPKKASKSKSGQTSINNFFASPSKPKIGDQKKRSTSVISIIDSDDELPPQNVVMTGGDDEKVARELQEKFDTERNAVSPDKGKGKEIVKEEEDDDDGIEIVKEEVHIKKEGINGSSSSKVHPMFAPAPVKTPTKPKQEPGITIVKAEPGNGTTNGSPAKITTSSAEAVEPIDFDVDQFLFRPSEVDVSKWPKGRLPYSVLVGVYLQVSSTRSRLLIVRVLTKYVLLYEIDLRLMIASYTSYYTLPQSTLHQHSTSSPTTYSPPTSPASSASDHKS